MTLWDRLPASRTVFEHKTNGIFGHGKCFALILSVGDDFRDGGDPNGKAALFFRLKHDGEGARMIQFDRPFWNVAIVRYGAVLSTSGNS